MRTRRRARDRGGARSSRPPQGHRVAVVVGLHPAENLPPVCQKISKIFHQFLLGRRRARAHFAPVHPDRLRVHKLVDAEVGELAAVARVLGAAERDLRRGLGHAVYVGHAGLQLVDEPLLLVRVVGPGGGAEAEVRVVGEGYGLVYAAHPEERGDGAEDLLPVRRRIFGDVREHGRRVEVAWPLRRLAPGQHLRPGLHALLHLPRDVLEDLGCGERAHVRVLVHRVADLQRGHALDVAARKVVGYLLVDDDAFGVDARLAVIEGARRDGGAYGFVQVGARHRDKRVAAAELEHGLLYVPPGLARHLTAGRLAAGERRRPHARVVDDGLDLARGDQERLEGPLGETGPADDVLYGERALGHVGGVLEQTHVSGHERGCCEPEDLPEREVPRHDREHGTDGLVADERARPLHLYLLVGEHRLGVLGVVAAAAGALVGLAYGRGERLAHLERHDPAELFGLFFEDLRRPRQPPRPLGERGLPVLAEGLGRELQLPVYLLVAQGFEGLELLARRRVYRRYSHRGPPQKIVSHLREVYIPTRTALSTGPRTGGGTIRGPHENGSREQHRAGGGQAPSGRAGARGGLRPSRGDAGRASGRGRRAAQGVAGCGDGRGHGLYAQARGAAGEPQEAAEERQERGLARGLVLPGGASRERRRRRAGGAVRLGAGLPRGDQGQAVQVEGGARRGAGDEDQGPRLYRRGAAPRAVRGPEGWPRVLRAELLPHRRGHRVLLLPCGLDRRPGTRARRARHGNLRALHPLHGPVPDGRDKGPWRGGREALHLLPHHRERRRDPARAARSGGRLGLRLRRLPGGLPVQQDEGHEEPLARVLGGGRRGTVPGDRRSARDPHRRGVRGALRGYPAHAAGPGGPPQELLRGGREPEAGGGRSGPRGLPARRPIGAGSGARGLGARRDRGRRGGASGGCRFGGRRMVPGGDPPRARGRGRGPGLGLE